MLLSSCTYDFSEDYFKEIQTNNPNVKLSLTGFSDGEKTSSSKIVKYVITGVTNNEFEIVVKIDETEIHRSNNKTGEFYLYVDELIDGNHKLTVEYIFPTNSGSLADSIGNEFFTGKTTYNFTLDKSLANPLGISSITIRQGSIYITLNPITDNNFEKAYLLIKNEFGYIMEERPISKEDLTDLEIHDDQTTYYNPSYAIKIKNAFTEKTSEFVLLPTPKMNFTLEPLDYLGIFETNYYKLIYNEHPLYGNFDKIFFEHKDFNVAGTFSLSLNPRGGESIITTNYYFGNISTDEFKIIKNNSLIGNFYEQLQLGKNLPISDFEEITYISSIDKYFIMDITASNNLIVYQLNGQSLEVEKSKTLTTLGLSTDFKSLDTDQNSNTILINLNKKSIVFNPVTFSIQNTFNAVNYNYTKPNADVYYRGNYIILEDPWPTGEVQIYETATGIQKFSINKTTKFFSAIDASFFYANKSLYQLQAGNFVFVNVLKDPQNNTDAPNLEHMTFDKVSNSAVFGWYRNTYYLDLSNYKQTNIWDAEVVYDVKYSDDGRPFINCNHFSAGNKSHIFDINFNETRFIRTSTYQPYRYFNGIIFSPKGFYLKTNLYKI